jgi:hypothetical protein
MAPIEYSKRDKIPPMYLLIQKPKVDFQINKDISKTHVKC